MFFIGIIFLPWISGGGIRSNRFRCKDWVGMASSCWEVRSRSTLGWLVAQLSGACGYQEGRRSRCSHRTRPRCTRSIRFWYASHGTQATLQPSWISLLVISSSGHLSSCRNLTLRTWSCPIEPAFPFASLLLLPLDHQLSTQQGCFSPRVSDFWGLQYNAGSTFVLRKGWPQWLWANTHCCQRWL